MSWSQQQQQNTGQYNKQQQYNNQYNNQYQRPNGYQQYQQFNSTQSLNTVGNKQPQNPYASTQQLNQHAYSTRSLNQPQPQRYNPYSTQNQQYTQSNTTTNNTQSKQSQPYTNTNNTHNPYTNYSNQQRQQYNNQYANRLANAYQSTAPPVPSPFLQAQQQKKAQQQPQQPGGYQPPPPPGPPPDDNNNNNNSNFKLIADSTPPNSDDENDNNNMRNMHNNGYNNMQNGHNMQNGMNNSDIHNILTAQQRMKQMISEQQKMIDQFRKNEDNLKKQLNERDTHWRQTLQNSLNKKDLRINELFQETLQLQQQNKEEQMRVVELRQNIMQLNMQSSQRLFTQKQLPGLPGNSNNNKSDINLSKSISIPETQEINNENKQSETHVISPNKSDKSVDNNSENKNVNKTDAIITENKSKDDKKNALAAMFGARKGNTVSKKSEKSEKSDENIKLIKYNKMKKLNMPMVSIINKMRMDGCSQDLISEFKGEKPQKTVSILDNPALSKYVKMKKIGMPMVSIINKMRMDGISTDLISEFAGEKKEDSGPNIDLTDSKFDKYKKMKKLNMPMASVINKMRMDGLNKDEIDAFCGNKKKKKKKDKKSQMQELAIAMGLKPKESHGPQKVKKLKRIHWKVIELKDIKGTFWENINKKYDDDTNIKLGAKFELDFQIRTRKPRLLAKKKSHFNLGFDKKKNTKKKERVVWIQGKRDQNIQIGLKTMGINNEEIYDSIVDMNDKIMTLKRLETIYELVPSVDEQRKAEEKIELLGDDIEYAGPSERFHVELSTIPEVKQQLSKWLFSQTFKELYMDRLTGVTTIIKACYAIKESKAFKCYLRIMLQIGNLMNHGIVDKSMAYGFDIESLTLLEGIKNFSGNKTLAMFLFEYAYNNFYNDIANFDSELTILKSAVRVETSIIENNIKAMADEFLNIDLFCRKLHDEYHPGDTVKFREYMLHFSELQTTNMMNLKVKIQNAQSIAKNVATYYGIKLDEGKPENLFKKVQLFVDIMDKAKRTLIKLEKERQKIAAKKAKEREKQKKLAAKNNKKDGGKKMKFSISQLLSRKKEKKQKEILEEEKGNPLFNDIRMAATKFAARQKKMEKRLSINFTEKIALSKGQLSPSMVNDKIKTRLSSAYMGNNNQIMLSPTEIKRLQNEQYNDGDDELNEDEYSKRMGKIGNHSPQKSNNLMVPQSPI